ncbi:MAG: TIGR04282 family arsenosugar biosynthesis glycosyltransferase, partial [Chromatiaceae bacterium]
QGDGDLGARMGRAARRVLLGEERVLLIGTDCPALSEGHLRAAAEALDSHDAALHPALDGGYPLLGLRAYHPSLFADIPWSTREVAALTLARLQALKWCVWLGESLPDIDEPADLIHLPEGLGLET